MKNINISFLFLPYLWLERLWLVLKINMKISGKSLLDLELYEESKSEYFLAFLFPGEFRVNIPLDRKRMGKDFLKMVALNKRSYNKHQPIIYGMAVARFVFLEQVAFINYKGKIEGGILL
ncbi:MAG: hypothetical protein ABIG60_00410 [Patescibacteria group bacterium]